jgi:hypothetical protein
MTDSNFDRDEISPLTSQCKRISLSTCLNALAKKPRSPIFSLKIASYSSPKSFVNEKGCVKKSSCGTLFHNPDRIAIAISQERLE